MDDYDPQELHALSTSELQALLDDRVETSRRLQRRKWRYLCVIGFGMALGCAVCILSVCKPSALSVGMSAGVLVLNVGIFLYVRWRY